MSAVAAKAPAQSAEEAFVEGERAVFEALVRRRMPRDADEKLRRRAFIGGRLDGTYVYDEIGVGFSWWLVFRQEALREAAVSAPARG